MHMYEDLENNPMHKMRKK